MRKTEGGRVQGRAVVSRFTGQGCGGCREAQMGRTLPLRNRNTETPAHTQRRTRVMFALIPRGRFALPREVCTYVFYAWQLEIRVGLGRRGRMLPASG